MKTLPKVAVVLMALLLSTINLSAQAPGILWSKTYGDTKDEEGYEVQQTLDGGYIIVGYTRSFGAGLTDVYLIKTDSIGDTLWTKTYGGSEYEIGFSVCETYDKGFIVAGRSNSFSASWDIYLIKTDSLGQLIWSKTYGGDNFEEAQSVKQTTDGGYIIAGFTKSFGAGNNDVYLIKTDSIGDTLWTKTIGDTALNEAYSLHQTTDGGYVITGRTGSYFTDDFDVYLVKTDSLGDTLWTKSFGGSMRDEGYSVQQTLDGGYIITGQTESFATGNCDVYLVKTDSVGDTIWVKTFGGPYGYARGHSVDQTKDGGYVVAGEIQVSSKNPLDVYLIKTDSLGDTLWADTYGGYWGYSVHQTTDGGYIVAGAHYISYFDVYLLKIEQESGIKEQNTPKIFFVSQSEPNPFYNKITIKYELPKSSNVHISIYNTLGARIRTLLDKTQNKGVYSITWNGRDENGNKVPSGFYFLRLETGDNKATRKLLLLR